MSDDDTMTPMDPTSPSSNGKPKQKATLPQAPVSREQPREIRAEEDDLGAMHDRSVLDSVETPLDDDARLEIFRSQFMAASLPSLPKIPGWHMCWVSTQNERDTVPLRMALGYVPVQPSEIAGWQGGNITTLKSGELAGWVNHNEMVAMKIREELYQKYMEEAHHAAPAREDMKLVYDAERISENARSDKAQIFAGDGIEELKRMAGTSRFRNAAA